MEAMNLNRETKKKPFSPTRRIATSFLVVIIIGTILLSLPIANRGVSSSLLNNFFVATSATCVTGLVPLVVVDQYSFFGQVVILILIQIGGLGFLTYLNLMFLLFKKKMSFTNKIIMQEALNQGSMRDISVFVKKVIKYTFCFELLGAALLSFAFVPEFGFIRGLYYSVFHSISAFCNAGFDILGSSSLLTYQSHAWINFVVCFLIIAGGLGFVVWVDLRSSMHRYKENFKKFKFKKYLKSLSLHTKLVLTITLTLLTLGTLIVFALEYSNPQTLGPLPLGEKVLTSFFQSTTLRTAGFATIDIQSLHVPTKLIMCIFMLIGGSPAGTAGGIKTVTFVLVVLSIFSLLKGDGQINIFKRKISDQLVKRALTIVMISVSIVISAIIILSATETLPLVDLLFESFSAFATVGLTSSVTPYLTSVGKLVIIVLMYIGRIGPITMVLTFASRFNQMKGKGIVYPEGNVLIG